jgi:hypothetical protein
MVNLAVRAFVGFRFSRGQAFFPPQSWKLRVPCCLKSCFSSLLSIEPGGGILLCVASSRIGFYGHSLSKYVIAVTHTSDDGHSLPSETMVDVDLSYVTGPETSRQGGRGKVEGARECKFRIK